MHHTREKALETCLVIMTGLLVFFYFFQKSWLLILAFAIGFIGAFIPIFAKWINWFWYKLALVLGSVSSKILLSIIFFLFLFPIALIYRWFNKDVLQLKKKTDGSYWSVRQHKYEKKDLENMW